MFRCRQFSNKEALLYECLSVIVRATRHKDRDEGTRAAVSIHSFLSGKYSLGIHSAPSQRCVEHPYLPLREEYASSCYASRSVMAGASIRGQAKDCPEPTRGSHGSEAWPRAWGIRSLTLSEWGDRAASLLPTSGVATRRMLWLREIRVLARYQ